MSGKGDEYRAASARAREARSRLLADYADARQRLSPERLKSDAAEIVLSKAHAAATGAARGARAHPLLVGGLGAGVAGWFFRRPIWALSRRLIVQLRDRISRYSGRGSEQHDRKEE
jgi:hypothetical protein